VNAAVLIPIKAFSAAKGRLEAVLDRAHREQLARFTAGQVVIAARPLPTYVVCDDESVAEWARDVGATVVWAVEQGLNGAVNHAVSVLAAAGHDHVLVVHGDLPLPPHLGRFARPATVTLVPDGRLDGTNLLAFPPSCGFQVAYGAGSFRRHLDAAFAMGLAVEVVRDQFLALDIDHPSDLLHPLIRPLIEEVLPSWLPTNPDNRHTPR
jgi:2-phospho-L-lactate guanylyltransferase